MCDEAVLAIKDIGRLDYSLKQYMTFAEIMIEKAQDLNKMSKINYKVFKYRSRNYIL